MSSETHDETTQDAPVMAGADEAGQAEKAEGAREQQAADEARHGAERDFTADHEAPGETGSESGAGDPTVDALRSIRATGESRNG